MWGINMFKFFRKKQDSKTSAVIVAAGSSSRMGQNKLLMEIMGIPVLVHTLRAFDTCNMINEIILVCREEDIPEYTRLITYFNIEKVKKVIVGGDTRSKSVLNGVLEVSNPFVAIHDGARPLIQDDIICDTINTAFKTNAAAPAVLSKDSIKTVQNGMLVSNVDRESVALVQTPQVFDTDLIKGALTKALDFNITDDVSAVELLGVSAAMTQGSYHNIKITTPEDILFAQSIWSELK